MSDTRVDFATIEPLLVREIHHRFANSLMLLASALRQEFATCLSPEIREALDRYESKLVAFGNLHQSLLVSEANDLIATRPHFERLCKALSQAILNPLGIHCKVAVDAGEIAQERFQILGLIVTELVTNAAKHAFLNRDEGLVQIELVNKFESWTCAVSDDGCSDDTISSCSGNGSRIIQHLVEALNGHFVANTTNKGTRAVLTFRT